MKKIIFASCCLFSVIVMTMCLLVSCGGGGGGDIIDEDAEKYTPNKPSQQQQQQQQQQNQQQEQQQQQQGDPVVVKDISTVNVDESGSVPKFSFAAPQQVGGKGELIASGTGADEKVILGNYNTDKGCYEFDLSILESNQLYTFKIKVYNKEGKVVVESSEKTVTMSDTFDSAKINPQGESGGTRSK